MKRIFSGLIRRIAFVFAFIVMTYGSFGQGPIDPECDPLDPTCPIDDQYWVLIAAIVIIACIKAYKKPHSMIPGL